MEVSGAKCTFLSQTMSYLGTLSGSVLCHGYCHTSTKLSSDMIKLSKCVLKIFVKVLKALNWSKRTAGSRDMVFLAKNAKSPLR